MTQTFNAPIVGGRYRPPAADVLNNLPGETPLLLIREPENPYDSNAVKVVLVMDPAKNPELIDLLNTLADGDDYPSDWQMKWRDEPYHFHLGYIPAKIAVDLAYIFDAAGQPFPGKLMFNMEGRPVVEFDLPQGEINGPSSEEEGS